MEQTAGGDTLAVARRIRSQVMTMATAITTDPMLPQPYSVREVAKETPDTFTLRLEPENAGERKCIPARTVQHAVGVWSGRVAHLDQWRPSLARPPGLHRAFSRPGNSCAGESGSGRQRGCTRPVRGRLAGRGRARTGRHRRGWRDRAGAVATRDLSQSCSNRKDYGRLVVLYGARSPRDLLYRKELATWARNRETQVLVTVDYGGLSWRGHVGVVTTLFKYCAPAAGIVRSPWSAVQRS